MAVIGIDPGTALTGYGIVEELADGSLNAVSYGVLKTDPKESPESRLSSLFEQLNEFTPSPQSGLCGCGEIIFPA